MDVTDAELQHMVDVLRQAVAEQEGMEGQAMPIGHYEAVTAGERRLSAALFSTGHRPLTIDH